MARQIQKNLKNIICYSCYESSKAGKCHAFLVSFVHKILYLHALLYLFHGQNDSGLALLRSAKYFQRLLIKPR